MERRKKELAREARRGILQRPKERKGRSTFETETTEEKEIRLQYLLIGIKFIMPGRPYVFSLEFLIPSTNVWWKSGEEVKLKRTTPINLVTT